MSSKPFKRWNPKLKQFVPGYLLATFVALLAGLNLHATPTVTTLAGGKPSKYYGYADGATLQSLFHTPSGLAIDSTGEQLYVADRDNNVIRYLDFSSGLTWTLDLEPTNAINTPVGVLLNNVDETYVVLNYGNGKNGSVVSFDAFGDLLFTNAANLTNAAGITIDFTGNIFITASNKIIKISNTGVRSDLVTIATPGTSLAGIAARSDGMLAVCDSGRNGIYLVDPNALVVTTNAGFNGVGDFTTNSTDFVQASKAKFSKPTGITVAGDGSLIVSDYSNNRIKVIANGIVTNLAGISQKYWHGTFPGWQDGPVIVPDSNITNAESRLPFGVVFSPDGTVYMSEDFYHTIRKVTGAGFGLPPPPPTQIATPEIGYVDFPEGSEPVAYTSVFHDVTNTFIFNNDAPIIIEGAVGSQTFYTFSNTPTLGLVPNPTSSSASAVSGYQDGLDPNQVVNFEVAGVAPFVAIKAISEKNDGSPNSTVAQALFEYVAGNPLILGGNAAQFTISDVTSNALIYYTIDGSNPLTNSADLTQALTLSTNGGLFSATINFATNNILLKAFARRPNYQDSQVVSNFFSSANFAPNLITFGVTNGELSSSFIARPGQFYYVPVTLQLQPGGDTLYSLQFNLTVTNGPGTAAKIVNDSGFNFFTMLETQVVPSEGDHFPPNDNSWYLDLPPLVGGISSSLFTNSSENLIGVGWVYRIGEKYTTLPPLSPVIDFDTAKQDLIAFSIAHDTLFKQGAGTVILGAYSFSIPTNANLGDTYDVQIGSPSGTRDGVGSTPAEDAFIQSPAHATVITVGTPSYLVGDAAPFRWLNAGDFGNSNLDSADVQQVYQTAILGVDSPPPGSDLYAAMDSSGTFGVFDAVHGYYTNVPTSFATLTAMANGDDTSINTNCFGDGILDVSDLYVTYRRSLDPGLTWYRRFWTNGQFVAVSTPNLDFNNNSPGILVSKSLAINQSKSSSSQVLGQPNFQNASLVFNAGDIPLAAAGQTVSIPITANVLGGFPLRIVGLNLAVQALDGSPAITQTVSFAPSPGLGSPAFFSQPWAGEYCAAWLTNGITGLTGSNALIGTLSVAIPANATANSAYAIEFNHASGSPNGVVSFPNQKFPGLITLSSRTNSSFNDGIPDSWRLRWFGTIQDALSQSNADACGDGISNWQKYLAGVNPLLPNDFPQLKNVSSLPGGSTAAIHWPSVTGKHYVVLRSTTLFSQSWSILSTNSGTGGDMEYDDNFTGKTKFYRVLIQP